MIARSVGEAKDGVKRDVAEAARRSHPIALDDVLRNGDESVFGELGPVKGSALAFGEILATSGAAETANVAGLARPTVGPKIALACQVEERTLGVGTGERGPITLFHDALLAVLLNLRTA